MVDIHCILDQLKSCNHTKNNIENTENWKNINLMKTISSKHNFFINTL